MVMVEMPSFAPKSKVLTRATTCLAFTWAPSTILTSVSQPATRLVITTRFAVARASVSFDPSERGYADAETVFSGATNILLANIDDAPKRGVRTDYVRGWERYGSRVGADYSFNFVPKRRTFAELLGPGGSSFLNFAVELDFENFPMETDEARSRRADWDSATSFRSLFRQRGS